VQGTAQTPLGPVPVGPAQLLGEASAAPALGLGQVLAGIQHLTALDSLQMGLAGFTVFPYQEGLASGPGWLTSCLLDSVWSAPCMLP
jgi:hypothetical protein